RLTETTRPLSLPIVVSRVPTRDMRARQLVGAFIFSASNDTWRPGRERRTRTIAKRSVKTCGADANTGADYRSYVQSVSPGARPTGNRIERSLLRCICLLLAQSGRTEMSGCLSAFGGGLNGSTQHYPARERWSVRRCVEVIFEALRHQRKQSFGIAG